MHARDYFICDAGMPWFFLLIYIFRRTIDRIRADAPVSERSANRQKVAETSMTYDYCPIATTDKPQQTFTTNIAVLFCSLHLLHSFLSIVTKNATSLMCFDHQVFPGIVRSKFLELLTFCSFRMAWWRNGT